MDNDRIWILLGKRLSGNISSAELLELDALLKNDPEAAASADVAAAIWQTPLEEITAPCGSKERIWNTVRPQLPPSRYSAPLRRLLATAAAAAVFAATWAGWQLFRPAAPALQQISASPGSKSRVSLPDGSIVWLNSNTQLHYDKNGFGNRHRNVTLAGEAFFDIAKSEGVPFIIHAGQVNIRVLGTAFNVKAYASDSTVATTLVRGKIAVSFRNKTVVLRPEEKLTVPLVTRPDRLRSQHLEKDSSGQPAEISWLQHKLIFDNNTFAELADKMSRWYGITFRFKSASLQQLRFSGIIDRESPAEALKMLQLSRHFSFRIDGNDVYISD
ncbi:ferric-dicitrate binding protein FerR, regulates iron transport through sigma-19 [Chitinophaga eiseniae]|uniref:Ferric-dicitrate binding protein FerR, regulates iron transport through sigma-19 n=1 Tax=Chitinophaga eiseniae TaxID=634771 RepID=A0A1T4N9Z7_9BACT|nr:FecR family protein [Chitinophaga eiseniae]SJZ75946.1 ferric-dicitrate binding protein FerR, regulates iron transport through sigma-19 [Chitinophaga eiseniae]